MIRHRVTRSVASALVVAATLSIALPALVVAHAELVRSRPGDGDTVQGTPASIRADFSEELADGSEMALLDASGTTLATGGIDPANASRMRIDPPELEPGDYEVQWKSFSAEDGDLETGTFTFTVSAPVTPPPSAPPTPSSPVSAAPSQSGPPSASAPLAPSPTEGEPTPPATAASTSDILLPIIAAVVLVAVLGGYLLMRRRPSQP
jgi:copper resistance protein C